MVAVSLWNILQVLYLCSFSHSLNITVNESLQDFTFDDYYAAYDEYYDYDNAPFLLEHTILLYSYYQDYNDGYFGRREGGCPLFGNCYNQSNYGENQNLKASPICYCDQLCSFFNDCCYEYVKNASNGTPYRYPPFGKNESFSCVGISTKGKSIAGYYMVTGCKEAFVGSFEEAMCNITTIVNKSTVPVVSNDNVVFRNEYCAQCNDVYEYKYFILLHTEQGDHVDYSGDSQRLNEITSLELYSYLLFHPKYSNPRKCVVIESNVTTNEECIKYQSPVLEVRNGTPAIYRNEYCSTSGNKLNETIVFCYEPVFERYDWYSLTVIINFNNRDDEIDVKENKDLSSPGCFIENGITGDCQSEIIYYNLKLMYLVILDIADANIDILDLQRFISICIRQLERIFSTNSITALVNLRHITNRGDCPNEFYSLSIKVEKNGISSQTLMILERYLSQVVFEFVELDNIDGFQKNKILISFSETTCSGDELIDSSRDSYIATNFLTNNDENKFIEFEFYKCLTPHMKFRVNLSSIQSKYTKSYDIFALQLDCFSIQNISLGSKQLTFKILTYSFFCISLISLAIALIVHRKLKLNASIPDCCLVHIIIVLFLAMSLFLVGIGANDYYIVCYIVGVILHFLWMGVFSLQSFSLLFLTVDIFHILKRFRRVNVSNKMVVFLGYLIPLILVSVGVALQLCNCTGFIIEYGNRICFPSGYHGSLFLVAVPISFCIVLNLILVAILGVKLRSHAVTMEQMMKVTALKYIGIMFRLTLASGIFWIFEILNAFWANDIISYISVSLNGLQGLFLAVSFLSSRDIRNKVRMIFSGHSSETVHKKLEKVVKG